MQSVAKRCKSQNGLESKKDKSKFQRKCVKPPLVTQYNNRNILRWNTKNAGSCKREVHGKSQSNFIMGDVWEMPNWRSQINKVKSMILLASFWKRSKQNAENSNRSLGFIFKAKCRDPEDQHTAKCRWKPEHGTPAVALTRPYSSEVLQAPLCCQQQWFRKDRPTNALLSQKMGSTRPWFPDQCDVPIYLRKLLNDFQVVVEQTKNSHWSLNEVLLASP